MTQKDIEIILLRRCASYLTMPIWLMDPDGELLYYNEAAEPILGKPFEAAGRMPGHVLAEMYQTTAEDGSPIGASDLPINIALVDRKPAHLRFRILGLDGHWRLITVTAFPLEGQEGRNLGAMAIFWEVERE